MKKELINKFYELKENGGLDKFLETEVKEVVKESYENSLSGWYYHIILSEEGLYITGALSQGTQIEGCFKGDEILLAKIPASNEIEINLIWDDILNLGETVEERFDKQKLILEEIIFKQEVQDLKEEIEESNKNFDLQNCINDYSTYLYVEDAFRKLFPEAWQKIIDEQIEYLWCDYDKDYIENLINGAIDNYRE